MVDDRSVTGMPWPVGQIFACVLRDELVARARGGDQAAIELLVSALPHDLPANIRRAARNAHLRKLATDLHAVVPGMTDHRVANLLVAAGWRIQEGAPLAGPLFDGLASVELTQLKTQIRSALRWTPARHDGSRWPKLRQMLAIIRR